MEGPSFTFTLFAGHVDGPGLFAYLITILSVLLIILTLPVSLIFAVKVVQVQFSTMYSKLKGQCHEMDIFFRPKHFNQYFLCMR